MTEPKTLVYWRGPWWLLSLRCPTANMAFRVMLDRRRFAAVRGERAFIIRWRREYYDE